MNAVTVPAVISRFRELKLEWLCLDAAGELYWSDSGIHHTFETVEELEAAHAKHGGVMLSKKAPETHPAHGARPAQKHAPRPAAREHWLIEWERERDP